MTDLEQLIQRTPNDSELGQRVRELYRATVNNRRPNATTQKQFNQQIQSAKQAVIDWDEDKTYRELLSLPEKEWPEEFEPGTVYPRATVNNSKSTSVTTVENQLELPI